MLQERGKGLVLRVQGRVLVQPRVPEKQLRPPLHSTHLSSVQNANPRPHAFTDFLSFPITFGCSVCFTNKRTDYSAHAFPHQRTQPNTLSRPDQGTDPAPL
jgi:hypothetical protein